jgi:hypothetical protein
MKGWQTEINNLATDGSSASLADTQSYSNHLDPSATDHRIRCREKKTGRNSSRKKKFITKSKEVERFTDRARVGTKCR